MKTRFLFSVIFVIVLLFGSILVVNPVQAVTFTGDLL